MHAIVVKAIPENRDRVQNLLTALEKLGTVKIWLKIDRL
jgi:hypothetical protein